MNVEIKANNQSYVKLINGTINKIIPGIMTEFYRVGPIENLNNIGLFHFGFNVVLDPQPTNAGTQRVIIEWSTDETSWKTLGYQFSAYGTATETYAISWASNENIGGTSPLYFRYLINAGIGASTARLVNGTILKISS